jgi:crossover junction endodeoxyribonuclease RuvC
MTGTSSCVCGIDPGLSGAVAFYFPEAPDRVAAEDIPVVAGMVDCATLATRIRQMAPDLAIVERVASMPKQGVSSTFKFGTAFGAILGVLAALEIRTSLVTPQVWKRHFRLDADKEKSRALALRTFPKTSQHFARKKDHGRAEASLIALYGAHQFPAPRNGAG